MANHAIFIGWNRPSVGREQQALKLWEKSMEYYGKLQADGRIESFEPVILSSHGGDLNGFLLIRGDRDKLYEIRNEDTFLNLTVEGDYCLDDFGIISAYIGEGLADVFTRWTKQIGG
jgi:hypothetical protein